jgi:hypothetical protein
MKTWQSVVRYCAIALALVLIISIASCGLKIVGIALGLASVGTYDEARVYSFDAYGIDDLEIDIASARFTLESTHGDKIAVKTNIKSLTVNESDSALKIKEKNGFINADTTDAFVEVFFPVGYEFDMVDIDAGAGDISVSRLTAKRLDADLGAGDTYLNFLTVTDEADIDGGVGILSISNAEITDLDLDLGVGYFSFHGIMNGNNTISFGVGESLVDFYDDKERYYFDVDKGIGEIEYYGTEDFNFVRSGQETTVRLEEGIGKITVRFFDKIDNE